jgi:hypothetical protein
MEGKLFAGAGAKVFWPGSDVNSYKMLQKGLNFFRQKFEVEFRNNFFRSYLL